MPGARATTSFNFQAPPASEDRNAPALLPHNGPGKDGLLDNQKNMFLSQVYEKEDEIYNGPRQPDTTPDELMDGLTPYQISLLERVRRANTDPIIVKPNASKRSPAQKAASQEMHKRVNPGFVEMPYRSSSALDYKYTPPPDFTREYMKADSDCQFQKFASEAILKHVDLNKTSH